MQAWLVDGSFLLRTILTGILVDLGFEVSADKDGNGALERLDQGLRPELLVLDLDGLTETGMALLYRLRQQPGPRILVISQEGGAPLIRRARLLGADAGQVRPVDRAAMSAALTRLGLGQPDNPCHAVGC